MKYWYKSPAMKGILLVIEHISAILIVFCVMLFLLYPGYGHSENFIRFSDKDFEETKGFEKNLQNVYQSIWHQIQIQDLFETDGKYDPAKIFDIPSYIESRKVTGNNQSGISYYLDDLVKWSKEEERYKDEKENIVVCEKNDGTYEYFYINDFESKMESGLTFLEEGDVTYLQDLKDNFVLEGSEEEVKKPIVDENGEIIYTDCWNLEVAFPEVYKTINGKTLMEIANEDATWNGQLTHMYTILKATLEEVCYMAENYEKFIEYWSEGNTNLAYIVADFNQARIYTNRKEFTDINQVSDYVEKIKSNGKYIVVTPKLADFETNMKTEAEFWYMGQISERDNYIMALSVDTNYPIQDTFYLENKMYNEFRSDIVVGIGGISIIAFLACFLWLTVIAGRTGKDHEIHLNWIDRIKTELALVGFIFLMVLAVSLPISILETWIWNYNTEQMYSFSSTILSAIFENDDWILLGLGCLLCTSAFFISYLSMVRRVKAGTLWKNSLLRWILHGFRKFLEYRSCTFKATLALVGFIIVHWIAIGANGSGIWMLFTFFIEGVAIYWCIRKAIAKQRIKDGIQKISEGDVEYVIPLAGLSGTELDVATHINHIGEGLSKAVEKSMKDERLKTDLITNVSHDIKTPLTSIINYVDLLKRENIPDSKIQGYLDILEAKSQRLKHLTEDVVEASKISSGNITMEYMDINFVEMINQTSGEFAEKFGKRNLQIVMNLPEHAILIRTDGRRMWRVIENIYNNAAKYALEGTRVYADLTERDDTVEFSLKNISEQPLNISADELTERFIRGDVSRSTEGSGLGLSIAKSLTELQGGKFDLYLDGDLFKVTITFPKIVAKKAE